MNKTNDKFVEGKLYQATCTNNPAFCRYNTNEIISCKANSFIFLGKNPSDSNEYLFYAISECEIVDIDCVWAISRLKELE